ncbi:L-alanine-DL-glutamate epimerase [Halopenitus malekzadehii]|uniref:o-succinylbenzoate synthase n=1 Tax=Halopenitus malekzadehii TaxID=1267564 RepID=A0A1H6K0H9_9EURY|nr:enolase C-terminal domain-like protein [Halopenitus malekzadehii]SEH64892.1 L-alanine-DL-glutamate epimerase [Halopenitus malekzadehii]
MRVTPVTLELDSPLRTASAEILEREGWLVGLDPDVDDVPARGVGEATPLPDWTESPSACADALATARESGSGPAGVETPAARHGITLARADAAARADDRRLTDHLAESVGFSTPGPAASVPVNATVGEGSAASAARAARRAVDDGTQALKLKAGSRPLAEDLDRVRAVRREVGPAVEIRVDANGAWDRTTARRALDAMADIGVIYVEQPLPANDLNGHVALRDELPVDVALDESVREFGIDRVLEAGAADVVICKPMVLGGVDRTVDAARKARAADVEPIVTTTIDGVIARTAAVHAAAAIPDVRPCGLATGSLLREDLAPDPAPVERGTIDVPEGPGIAGDAFDDYVFDDRAVDDRTVE